ERDVVIEERRMRTDNDPSAQLSESLAASLFVHHPYGTPIIGWMHEIENLGRDDALSYYRRFYTPENAILVVAGDVTRAHVLALAEKTYGQIPARGDAPRRQRPLEPEARTERLVRLADAKVEQPSLQRMYLAPSFRTAENGEAEALELLAHLIGSSQTGWLYRRLVVEQNIAVNAGAWYMSTALDQSRFGIYAVPAEGVSLDALDTALEKALREFIETGLSETDLARAKTRLIADAVYAQDSQVNLARIYGSTLACGGDIADVQEWPARIDAITAEQVRAAAARYLVRRKAVTGYLDRIAA
ncbi:MAG: M16 family metallopeptidase, partial [Beijerinckiaceae bacterium]